VAYFVSAECPNACNGHGTCTSYDMCVCQRNWQANDCSERTCQFGIAHVDTPKGDLNQDGQISGPDYILVENNEVYKYGTTEQFPRMQDSSLEVLTQSAHYYMECSNKGTCDRKSGECQCFDGYDGAACQRASCPGYPDSCSGHGVCKTIRQLAEADNDNIYELWDKHSTMGCECDAGFFGPDCSLRECKFGIDPLYLDDTATIKYSTFDFAVLHTEPATYDGTAALKNVFTNGMQDDKNGYWAIRFFDIHGEDWVTEPIAARAPCSKVIDALNNLPNDVIPKMNYDMCTKITQDGKSPLDPAGTGSAAAFLISSSSTGWSGATDSYFIDGANGNPSANGFTSGGVRPILLKMAFWLGDKDTRGSFNTASSTAISTDYLLTGDVYRVHFFNNPGKLREPIIETMLDGDRPSLWSVDAVNFKPRGQVITAVWTDGQQGENFDYIADHCDGVQFTISNRLLRQQDSTTPGHTKGAWLSGLTVDEVAKLKTCLGESDFDFGNNNDVYEWDHGSIDYPHLVKLVRTVTTSDDGGYYAALYYDTLSGQFQLINQIHASDDPATQDDDDKEILNTDVYEIYTTKGVLARVSGAATAVFGFGAKEIYSVNKFYEQAKLSTATPPVDGFYQTGDISCELTAKKNTQDNFYEAGILNASITGRNNGAPNLDMFWYDTRLPAERLPFDNQDAYTSDAPTNIFHCLNKGSLFTMLNFYNTEENPPHINLYTAEKLYQKQYKYSQKNFGDAPTVFPGEGTYFDQDKVDMDFETYTIVPDFSTNWASGSIDDSRAFKKKISDRKTDDDFNTKSGEFQFYKFYPARESSYNYVAQCSNRGICQEDSGVCECFNGYTGDSCSEQNSLAV